MNHNTFAHILTAAIPVACISWTLTKEEITRDVREWLAKFQSSPRWWVRKLTYLPACYYCTSHYVTLALMLLAPYMLGGSWLLAFFATVWVAQVYLTTFNILRAFLRGVVAWADKQELDVPVSESKGKTEVRQMGFVSRNCLQPNSK